MTLRAASGTLSFGLIPAPTGPAAGGLASAPELRRRLGQDLAQELQSILQERNAALRAEGLLNLAARLDRRGRPDLAAEFYTAVLATDDASLAGLSRQRLAALQGRAPLAARVESLGRRFVAHATDPRMIAAFGIGAWVSGAARLTAGAWLAGAAPGWLTRGLGARLVSGTAGYLAEVPAFVGASRLLAGMGVSPEEGGPGLRHELASAALFLGVLRVAGFAGGRLARGLDREGGRGGAWQAGASFAGVYAAHRLEEVFGLRPARDEAVRWVDTADTWLQMRVGARLLHGLGGAFEPGARFELLYRRGLQASLSPRPLRPLDLADPAPLPAAYLYREIVRPAPGVVTDPALQRLVDSWGSVASSDALTQVERIGRALGNLPDFVEVLEKTRPREYHRLVNSLRRVRHMVEHSRPIGARGNYLEWLVRWGVTESVRRRDSAQLEGILNAVHDGMDMVAFEKSLEPLFPQYRMRPMTIGAMRRALQNFHPVHRRIRHLPFGTPARDLLTQAMEHLKQIPPEDPLRMDMGHFVELVERTIRERDPLLSEIERALAPIPSSPLSYMRLFRLYRILAREWDVYPKYRELGGEGIRLVGFRERLRNPDTVEEVDSSQANGFYEEPDMAQMFAEFYGSMWRFVDGATTAARKARRREILQRLLPTAGPLTQEQAVRVFRELGDPVSLQVVESLESGAVELEFLGRAEFEAEVDRYVSGGRSRNMTGVIIPAEGPEGRNRILIRQLEQVSPEVFHDAAFLRLGFVVHEHEHHVHTPPGAPRSFLEITRQEMRSCHREFQWLAEHGEPAWVLSLSAEGATGWAMQLRSLVEGWNFQYKNPDD